MSAIIAAHFNVAPADTSFAAELLAAVPPFARDARLYEVWNEGFATAADRLAIDPPAEYSELELREWHRGFDAGLEWASVEEHAAFERMLAEAAEEDRRREFPRGSFAGWGLDATEF